MVIGPVGRNGACWCGGASSASTSAASSSTAAPVGALMLKGTDKLGVHGDEIYREPFDRGRELGDSGVIAFLGCCQVCVVRLCGGVVCGAVGSAGLVSKREEPLPVCGHKNTLRCGSVLSSATLLFHSRQSAAKITMLNTSWYALSTTCLLEYGVEPTLAYVNASSICCQATSMGTVGE